MYIYLKIDNIYFVNLLSKQKKNALVKKSCDCKKSLRSLFKYEFMIGWNQFGKVLGLLF